MDDQNNEFESAGEEVSAELPAPFTGNVDDPQPDHRLYVPENADWDVEIKRDSDRVYCYAKAPGQDWFHMILNGEIYATRQHERYCLECALRMGFLTTDRLFWQHRVPKRPPKVL